MTPEQFAKCREFASCYTTNSDMLGLASGMIGGLLDHIDTLTAERDALRHDMDRLSAADTEHCTALVAAEAERDALIEERDGVFEEHDTRSKRP